jgi:hypothetical protein
LNRHLYTYVHRTIILNKEAAHLLNE